VDLIALRGLGLLAHDAGECAGDDRHHEEDQPA